jgi:hypothetical protein
MLAGSVDPLHHLVEHHHRVGPGDVVDAGGLLVELHERHAHQQRRDERRRAGQGAWVVQIPTTSVRRRISLFSRSRGLFDQGRI